MSSPRALFERTGEHPDGSVASLEVKVCTDRNGQVWSVHMPMSKEDDAIFMGWPGCGVRAIAHAMLVEATRREAYLCALARLSSDINVINAYRHGDSVIKSEIERDIGTAVVQTFEATLPKLIPSVVKEILDMMSNNAPLGR